MTLNFRKGDFNKMQTIKKCPKLEVKSLREHGCYLKNKTKSIGALGMHIGEQNENQEGK